MPNPGRGRAEIPNPAVAAVGQGGPTIALRDVMKRFRTSRGDFYVAVHSLTFDVAGGEFCAIVGPTGSGKSTTLKLIAGLDTASPGEAIGLRQPRTGAH